MLASVLIQLSGRPAISLRVNDINDDEGECVDCVHTSFNGAVWKYQDKRKKNIATIALVFYFPAVN